VEEPAPAVLATPVEEPTPAVLATHAVRHTRCHSLTLARAPPHPPESEEEEARATGAPGGGGPRQTEHQEQVARVLALGIGVVYGSVKLGILKVCSVKLGILGIGIVYDSLGE
jgi:hypothetical protein